MVFPFSIGERTVDRKSLARASDESEKRKISLRMTLLARISMKKVRSKLNALPKPSEVGRLCSA